MRASVTGWYDRSAEPLVRYGPRYSCGSSSDSGFCSREGTEGACEGVCGGKRAGWAAGVTSVMKMTSGRSLAHVRCSTAARVRSKAVHVCTKMTRRGRPLGAPEKLDLLGMLTYASERFGGEASDASGSGAAVALNATAIVSCCSLILLTRASWSAALLATPPLSCASLESSCCRTSRAVEVRPSDTSSVASWSTVCGSCGSS